jgi:hypothetical protein
MSTACSLRQYLPVPNLAGLHVCNRTEEINVLMQILYFTLHCDFIVYNEHTLVNKSYSPSFNLISCFIYAQTVSPSDNTDKKVLYVSCLCFLPEDGPERAKNM